MVVRLFTDADAGRAFVLRNRALGEATLSPRMRDGIRQVFGEDLSAEQVVSRIIAGVRANGDEALRHYTEAIDGVSLDAFEVTRDEIEAALATVPADVAEALRFAATRIRRFHEQQHIDSWMDFQPEGALGQIIRPLERVGLYAPGGTAPYPSSLLMTAIPASVAGVQEIVVCAPPERDGRIAPVTAVAAHVAGVQRVFKLGGAQAIAAMALGTASVPKVDKILGPGNIFVVLAKRQVYGEVAIDALPGPTETLLIADESADTALCAADMLAQAEHDPMASAILLTTSAVLAERVRDELDRQQASLSRASIAVESLESNGAIVVVSSLEDAFEIANAYAPEHLCLLLADPWSHVASVKHAGGIFVGEHSPEVIGDYTAGPSHVMPTGRTARFSSPVNVSDFVKVISVIGLNERGLREVGPAAVRIAHAEGLTAHAAAVERRLERLRPE
ncbi:MAG TPA: histidinol dehydrogenase [Thermomicrobiales bacterium]|nr:histidinol dehydrogenase [Thermomicrobiales bacterium]